MINDTFTFRKYLIYIYHDFKVFVYQKALILAFNNKMTSKVICSGNPVLKANLKDF